VEIFCGFTRVNACRYPSKIWKFGRQISNYLLKNFRCSIKLFSPYLCSFLSNSNLFSIYHFRSLKSLSFIMYGVVSAPILTFFSVLKKKKSDLQN